MIAADPGQGGAAWAVLQYVLGLRGLGHDVYLVEPIPAGSIAPYGAPLVESTNARYFREVAARFNLTARAALLREDTRETIGLGYAELTRAVRGCDLLINISGMLTDPALFDAIPRRVYLDLDPAFNQLWHTVEHIDMRFEGHTHFFTVGGLIGTPACQIPTCGLTWQPVLQPIVLTEWPVTPGDPGAPWTTVGNWRGYGSITLDGVLYGQKAHSFRRLLDLPARSGAHIRPALMIHRGEKNDLAALRAASLGPRRSRGGRVDARRVSRVRARLERGAGHREERLCRVALRMVQRSERLLSRVGPSGDRAGHGLRRVSADRRRPVRVQHG